MPPLAWRECGEGEKNLVQDSGHQTISRIGDLPPTTYTSVGA
jgi:hypothetical protein